MTQMEKMDQNLSLKLLDYLFYLFIYTTFKRIATI